MLDNDPSHNEPLADAAAPDALPPQDRRMHELLFSRFERAASAHRTWAAKAKQAVEFFEGKQWSEEDLRTLEEEGRPALTLNHIKPLIKLVLGYHRTNRVDPTYVPANDGGGTEQIAEVLTSLSKMIAESTSLSYIDAEVFLDGILTGRGFYDCRLDFEESDLGDISWRSLDPFSTYIDPDATEYEPNTWGYVFNTRWASIDEVEACFGKRAAQYASAFISGNGVSGLPTTMIDSLDEITPRRTFGGDDSDTAGVWSKTHESLYDFCDPLRKNIKLVECQHYQWTVARVFVDLETGKREIIPDSWSPEKVAAVQAWNEERGNPIRVQMRRVRRLRWTTMAGDLAVYDRWSPYKTMTVVPFFPYFRRGITMGLVEDLIDPQKLINKLASAELNIMGRTANSGWMIPKGALNPEERDNLEQMGGAPGITVEWDHIKTKGHKPEQINAPTPPLHMKDMGERSVAKLKEIGGINDSALGNLDRVQSGRAIEARQKQSIVGIEPDMDNYRRSKQMGGRKTLEMLQAFYTERRVFRMMGEDSRLNQIIINERDPITGVVTNDITIGSFAVQVDETPISASFLSAVFDEMLLLRKEGVPIPDDMLVDASSFGRKEELKQRLQQIADAGMVLPPGTPPPLLPSPAAQQQIAAQAQQPGAGGPVQAQREAPQQEAAAPPQVQG